MNAKRKSQYNPRKIKYLILAVTALLSAMILTVIAYFAAFALTVLTGGVDISDTSTATVNQGIFNTLRFSLMIIIFGWFYYRSSFTGSSDIMTDEKEDSGIKALSKKRLALLIVLLMILGLSIQLGTSGILHILTNLFPETFAAYNELMGGFTDKVSPFFIFTVVIPGPIAEEILFRGLIQRYCSKFSERFVVANILQALLFGLYHGDIVQGTYAFIFGMLLGYLTKRTATLFFPMLLHIFINGSLYIIPTSILESTPVAAIVSVISVAVIVVTWFITIKRVNGVIH